MCKDCIHKDVCKYKDECSKTFDKLQEIPTEQLSPIRTKMECIYFVKNTNYRTSLYDVKK
jgi:hypothetical protein